MYPEPGTSLQGGQPLYETHPCLCPRAFWVRKGLPLELFKNYFCYTN